MTARAGLAGILAVLALCACEVDPPDCDTGGSSGCSCCLDRTMMGGCEAWSICRSCSVDCPLGFYRLVASDAGVCESDAAVDAAVDAGACEPDGGLDLGGGAAPGSLPLEPAGLR